MARFLDGRTNAVNSNELAAGGTIPDSAAERRQCLQCVGYERREKWRNKVRAWEIAFRLSLRVVCVGLDSEMELVIGDALGDSAPDHAKIEEVLSPSSTRSLVIMEPWAPSQGLQSLQRIKKLAPRRSVIVCTTRADKTGVLLGLGAGADGYLIKPFSQDQFLDALSNVLNGATFLCHRAHYLLAGAFSQWNEASRFQMSTREHQIMSCLLAGLGNKAIASELEISISAVHAHLTNIFSKLGVRSRGAAVRRYWNLKPDASV